MNKKQSSSSNNNPESNEIIASNYLRTSCCKFKPSYLNAIPYYKLAADGYYSQREFNKEIKCRRSLAKCFYETKSHWEEANEYIKIARTYIKHLHKYSEASIEAQNATNAFFTQHEYESAIKELILLSRDFQDEQQSQYSESCLSLAYNCILKIFHVIALKKETNSIDYAYDCMEEYLDVLIYNSKEAEVIDIIDKKILPLIKEEDKDNKEKIEKFCLIKCGCLIIFEQFSECEGVLNEMTYSNEVSAVKLICSAVKNADEKEFKKGMVDGEYIYRRGMCRNLMRLFNDRKERKNKKKDNDDGGNVRGIKIDDVKMVVEEDDDLDDFK